MTATQTTTTGGISAVQQAFFDDISAKAQQALGSQLGNVSLVPIQTGGLGFPYNYLYNGSVVRTTYDLLDAVAVPGAVPGSVQLGGSFSAAYGALLQDVSWTLSSNDLNTVTLAVSQSVSAQSTLVTAYQGLYGPITQTQMTAAGVQTPIDYIIDYQVRQIWSGTKSANKPPLPIVPGARNLQAQLPFLPSSAVALLTPLEAYINAMSGAWPILNTQSAANATIQSIIANVQGPGPANGGITTWNPATSSGQGSVPAVAYTTSPTAAALVNALGGAQTSSLEVNVTASYSHSDTLEVSVEAEASVEIPILDLVGLGVSGGASYNLFSYAGTGTEATIKASFPNPTLVHVTPGAYDQANSVGWYLAGIVSQAVTNTGNAAVSGYKFATKPAYDFGPTGDFARFLALAVSQEPTITVTYTTGSFADFQKSFEQHSSVSVTFLGIPIGKVSESTYSATATQDTQDGGFTLTLTPPDQSGLASYELFSFLIAGALVFPGSQPV